jgi:phenylacetic acid degradation operon negative regulatory protein
MSIRSPALADLVSAYHARKPPRTWSLIVTIFGDRGLPHGGAISLADLTGWMGALGVEPGLVRTALSRLVSGGTLTREREGRSAYYRLSGLAEREFLAAADLIYGRRLPAPTGALTLAILDEDAMRAKARVRLGTAGFVALAPNLMVRPVHGGQTPISIEGVIFAETPASPALARRGARLWPLAGLADGYRRVITAAEALSRETPAAEDALLARILLVHEFRRIVLKDPFLPQAMVPADWPGEKARHAFDSALARLSR